jgi:pimeloyl-ACP methyl ester carboxylesterase
MDKIRRGILATVAATAATGVARRVAAQQAPDDTNYSFYEKNGVRIRYRQVGSGFPILATPGGGLNSRMAGWPTAPINAMEVFKGDFRVITMDQRNANGGESTGPVPTDRPWDAFADDQLGLMDHLGIRQFMYFGNCIGGCFGLKLMERAPDRVVAAVLSQPVGHRPENPDVMYNSGRDTWGPEFRKRRPDVSVEQIETYLHGLYRARPDFVYSVSRDSVRALQRPILVLPDDTAAHAYQVSMDIAALAPKAEASVYPWTAPPELKTQTIERVRAFLKTHRPV